MSKPDILHSKIWASHIFFHVWQDYQKYSNDLIAFLLTLKSKENESNASGVAPKAKSNQGIFESRFNLFDHNHPSLNALKHFIGLTLKEVIHNVHGGKISKDRIEPHAPESWFHITNNGGFHDVHTHSYCSWCGIFYVQSGDSEYLKGGGAGNGLNRFYSPIHVGGMFQDFGTQYLGQNTFDVVPKDGQLVIFPSYLKHSALPYHGKTDRIVIAFNGRISDAKQRSK